MDGITATAIMYKSIKDVYDNVQWWVPDRLTDGYGLNVDIVREKITAPGLVITVDTGIAEDEKVQQLKELGYAVLITDHHIPDKQGLPPANVLLDPKLWAKEGSADYVASGGLVAAKLSHILKRSFATEDIDLDPFVWELVALGLLSDVIELQDTIKVILNYGLSLLSTSSNPGIRALLHVCDVKEEAPLTSHVLGFNVIPKLNAAGRMGQPHLGVELLLSAISTDFVPEERALLLAKELLDLNTTRKEIEAAIYEEAVAQAETYCRANKHTLVVYKPGWHAGVLGIVAARLMERYYRPTIVLTKTPDELIRGSARSIEDFDIYEAIKACGETVFEFGGHAVAAGITLEEDRLKDFKQTFERVVGSTLDLPNKIIPYSKTITLEDMQNIPWVMSLLTKEPIGNKNPEWIFKLEPVTLRFIGNRGSATTFIIENKNKQTMILKKFRPTVRYESYLAKQIEILVSPNFNYFGNTTNVEWRMIDLHTFQG